MLTLRVDAAAFAVAIALSGCGAEAILQSIQDTSAESGQSEPAGVALAEPEDEFARTMPATVNSSREVDGVNDELSLLREHLSLLRQVNDALAGVRDESTAVSAAKQIQTLADKMSDLAQQVQNLPVQAGPNFTGSFMADVENQQSAEAKWQLAAERIKEAVRFGSLIPHGSSSAASQHSGAAKPQLVAAVDHFISRERKLSSAQEQRMIQAREAYRNRLRSNGAAKDVAAPASGR